LSDVNIVKRGTAKSHPKVLDKQIEPKKFSKITQFFQRQVATQNRESQPFK